MNRVSIAYASSCILVLLVVSLLFASCSESSDEENRFLQSYTFSTKSHFTGQDCMNCHKKGGGAEGIFTIAGSVYQLDRTKPNPNGKILLYPYSNGVGSPEEVQVDALGNFYTTVAVNFRKGLYAAHKSSKDSMKYMPEPVTTGNCNSCHGGSTDKMWNY